MLYTGEGSAAVVGCGFGVDEQARDVRGGELVGVFQGRDDLVNSTHGEAVGERTVAVDLDAVVVGGHFDIVDVEDLGELAGGGAQLLFQKTSMFAGFLERGGLNGSRLGLDVGENRIDGGDFAAYVGFKPGYYFMRRVELESFVKFQMKFEVQAIVVLLDSHVMN